MTRSELLIVVLLVIELAVIIDLRRLSRREKKKRRVVRFAITRIRINHKPSKENIMQIQLRTTQYVALTLAPVDADGQPATLDGNITTTVVSGTATIRQVNGETIIVPGDVPGPVQVKVSGDAQPGEGVQIIEEIIDLDVQAANAVSLGLGFRLGAKKDLPADAPAT